MKVENFKLNEYENVLAYLKRNKFNFTVKSTKYSKRVQLGKKTLIFSDKPLMIEEMKLIQMVRTNADRIIVDNDNTKDLPIKFSKFFDTNPQKNQSIKGIKIDLSQTYWQCGINNGIICDKIINYFNKHFSNLSYKEQKDIKLRTLGSLATKLVLQSYKNGKLENEILKFGRLEKNRREVYMYICEVVADIMHSLAIEFIEHVIYYYWDCIFLADGVDVEKVIKKTNEMGYNSKIEGLGTFEISTGVVPFIKFHDNKKGKKTKNYYIDKDDLLY